MSINVVSEFIDKKNKIPSSGVAMDPLRKLPLISAGVMGIGGKLKTSAEYFIVREVPLYEAQGTGEHIYINITRSGWNTRDIVEKIVDLFGLTDRDIGTAGLKDHTAKVTQTFSICLPGVSENEVARTVCEHLKVDLNWVKRHKNKLRTGHLKGNHFEILVVDVAEDALQLAWTKWQLLKETGFPNYYGAQRFGREGDNAMRGRRILQGTERQRGWLKRLLLSAYQSHLFNLWLADRLQQYGLSEIFSGDVMQKTDSGGLFCIEELAEARQRMQSGAIELTGPMFGSKMKAAHDAPGITEEQILDQENIKMSALKKMQLDGSRRPARLMLDEMNIESAGNDALRFQFFLPRGAYATVILREFMEPLHA